MIEKNTIDYILTILCTDATINTDDFFAYCEEKRIPPNKAIIIIKSNFFDEDVYFTKMSLPQLPLSQINGIPLLYGEAKIEQRGRQIIIFADLIASTYFLISRYEEILRPEIRDKYGRFPGLESLPCRAGFIDRPVVDEYGRLLRNLMRTVGIDIQEPKRAFSNIYLTHDIDIPWEQFTVVSAIKRILGNLKRELQLNIYPIRNLMGYPERDPQYTFDEIIRLDGTLLGATVIYFIKSGGKAAPEDGPVYIHTKAFKKLVKKLIASNARLGYHVSCEAAQNMSLVPKEMELLQKTIEQKVCYSRNHYLLSKDPDDFYKLINSGITDDFTMGYADIAGFRLGTSRSVHWIDPRLNAVTSLVLHPLTIMEVSLFGDHYMALSIQDAKDYSINLIKKTQEFGGELCLLWHNTALIPQKKETQLYLKLLAYLSNE